MEKIYSTESKRIERKQFKRKISQKRKEDSHQKTIDMLETMIIEDSFSRHYNAIDEALYLLIADRLNYSEGVNVKQDEIISKMERQHVRILLNDILGLQMLGKQLRVLEQYALSLP